MGLAVMALSVASTVVAVIGETRPASAVIDTRTNLANQKSSIVGESFLRW